MEPKFRPYTPWPSSDKDAHALFENFETALQTRRSLRMYSKKQVSRTTVERLISLAASAPSGANKQPWHFVAVQNPEVKRKIREAAE
jgi:nitroreductase